MKLAGGFKRFLASMADLVIVSFLASIVVPIFLWTGNLFLVALGVFVLAAIEGIYFVYYETSKYKASPGKRLFGLYVATGKRKKISVEQAVTRYILWRISAILSMGLLIILPFLIKKRCLHDVLTDTNVFSHD